MHDQEQFPGLPPGYSVDETEDLLALRRPDGSVVAHFSALGATREEIEEAAEEDLRGSGRG